MTNVVVIDDGDNYDNGRSRNHGGNNNNRNGNE